MNSKLTFKTQGEAERAGGEAGTKAASAGELNVNKVLQCKFLGDSAYN